MLIIKFKNMFDGIEKVPQKESVLEKFEITPYEGEEKGVKNVVVILENTTPSYLEVVKVASENDAFIDNSDEEAGDSCFAIQFPGNDEPEFVDQYQLHSKLRKLGITE